MTNPTFFYPQGFTGPGDGVGSNSPFYIPEGSSWRDVETADELCSNYLLTLQGAARQLARTNPLAGGYFLTAVESVVGTGIRLQSQARPTRRERIERDWEAWGQDCEASGLNWWELVRLACLELLTVGEAFVIIRRDPLQLQLIEAEWVPVEKSSSGTGTRWRCGIQVDALNRPLNYLVKPNAKGGGTIIPAEDMIHLMVRPRPSQIRGLPRLHLSEETMVGLARYQRAETIRADVASSLIGTIEEPDAAVDMPPDEIPEYEDAVPGRFKRLFPGERLNIRQNDGTNPTYASFRQTLLETIAAGAGISYEALSSDYSRSNYSSSRLSQLRERDHWKTLQRVITTRLCRPVFLAWAQENGLNERQQQHTWQTRGWPSVDPTKDIAAGLEEVAGGTNTLTNLCADAGRDFEEVAEVRRRELDLIEQLDLPLASVAQPPEAPNDNGNNADPATNSNPASSQQGGGNRRPG